MIHAVLATISFIIYYFSKRFLFSKRKRFFIVFDFTFALIQSYWLTSLFFPSGFWAFAIIFSIYLLFSIFQAILVDWNFGVVCLLEFLRLLTFHYIVPFTFFEASILLDLIIPLDLLLFYFKSIYATMFIFLLISMPNQLYFVVVLSTISIFNFLLTSKSKTVEFDNVHFKTCYYERENDNVTLRQLLEEIRMNGSAELFVFSESIFSKKLNKSKVSNDYRITSIQSTLNNNQQVILGFNINDTPVIVLISHDFSEILQQKKIFIPHLETQFNDLKKIIENIKPRIFRNILQSHNFKNQSFSIVICFEACFTFNINKEVDFIFQFSEESFFNKASSYGKFLFNQQTRIRAKEVGKPVIKVSNS